MQGQLSSLQRLVSQAQGLVTLGRIPGIKTLHTMPVTTELELDSLGLTDLSSITPGAFPSLEFVILNSLPDIDGSELAPIRNIAKINLTQMAGLTGSNPLLGLAGSSFNTLFLSRLPNITTLADLTSVTTLRGLAISSLDGLINLAGLENLNALINLTSGGNVITVEDNKALQDLNGLGGITGALTIVKIGSNDVLTDISGLAGITGVVKDVIVYRNPLVTACDVLVQSRLNPAPSGYYFKSPPTVCLYSALNLVASANALDFGSIGSTRNSCTVTVRFTVDQTGVDQAQLGLAFTTSDNASVRTLPVNLTAAGTGVAGDQPTPNTNLDIGDVELGATQTDIITIDNRAGSGPLTVSSLMVTGFDFSLVGNSCGNSYPQTVAIGSQCAVTVSFIPSALQLTCRGAQNVPTQIPTLSEWARLTLIMLIAMISIGAMRRRLNTG